MTGGSEEATADQSGPEAVAAREKLGSPRKAKIEHLEFVRSARELCDVRPTAGDLTQDHDETENRASDVQEHLHRVGPDYRCHSTFEGIKQCQAHDYKNGDDFAGAQHDRDNNGEREHAYALCHGAQD